MSCTHFRLGGRRIIGAAVLGTLLLSATGASASTLYQLHDHPDGNAGPPTYGLRLDELFDVNDGTHDIFTFSFDHDGASMWLEQDGGSIHIWGTAFGGLNEGDGYDPLHSGWIDIDVTYSGAQRSSDGNDMEVSANGTTSIGSVRLVDSDVVVPLFAYNGDYSYAFRFGDDADDEGHRGFEGLSGWGWVNHWTPDNHTAASDWLFTAEVVPLPPAALMGFAGLAGAMIVRRRRGLARD